MTNKRTYSKTLAIEKRKFIAMSRKTTKTWSRNVDKCLESGFLTNERIFLNTLAINKRNLRKCSKSSVFPYEKNKSLVNENLFQAEKMRKNTFAINRKATKNLVKKHW